MKFGVIGYGSFGRLLTEVLAEYGEVLVYSRSGQSIVTPAKQANLAEISQAKVIILAIELAALDDISRQLAEHINPQAVVVDVCSVKLKPIEILNKNLGDKCQILATHPLFGPQTVEANSVRGKSIVVCSDLSKQPKIKYFLSEQLRLKIIEMSAEDHDKEMAWVHALTFFVGRGLMKLNPPKSQLTTGYYQKLLDLVELESTHSIELFNTVQSGNPFAGEIRAKLIEQLTVLDRELGKNNG